MVRLVLVVLVCAACFFADMPPAGLSSGSSSAVPTTTDATTGTGSGATGEATTTTGGVSGSSATGPETTTGPSTGSDPSTTAGAMTDSGTTGPLMWGDCNQLDTEVDCIGCCGQVIEASKVYYEAFASCLCLQGNPCMDTCGLDLCFFGTISVACQECAAGPGAECQNTAIAKCQDDPDCSVFLECTAENDCVQKP